MCQILNKLKNAHLHTKCFIFMAILYISALVWTTAQAYARLVYSRSDLATPIVIHIPPLDHH